MSAIRIGTAAWSIPKQAAPELPAIGSHLERYAQILSCAEINSSFYRSHRISTWQKWADAVPDNFRFSVKAPKSITHESQLACDAGPLKIFLSEARTLGDKLGPILFQLPPKSAFNLATAETFFTTLRDLYQGPAVCEPRHPTWFTAEVDQLLNNFHIARVAADPARTPEAAVAGGSNQLIYCRLHGSPRIYYSAYPNTYLQSLAAAIDAQPAKEIWCIFDNTASGAALTDALTLSRILSAADAPKNP
jgi:uncharacterized protein YecE (DUF72 family)